MRAQDWPRLLEQANLGDLGDLGDVLGEEVEAYLAAPTPPLPATTRNERLVGLVERAETKVLGDPPELYVEKCATKRYYEGLAADRAKARKAEEEFAESFRMPPSATLSEGLAVERPPQQYGVAQMLVKGGNALITAGFKAGKTDLMLNLLKSYCDDEPFLGAFDVLPMPAGKRIAFWDFELDEGYAWNLIKLFGIRNTERGVLQSWRGYSLPLQSESARRWAVEWLLANQVEVLIVDPFGAVYQGDENSNSEVRAWLRQLDEVKERAGVSELYLTIHTGKAAAEEGREIARGATAVNDWADAIWTYSRDTAPGTATPSNVRFLSARGRAVDVSEFPVEWDAATHALTRVEGGGSRATLRRRALRDQIVAHVEANPGAVTAAIKAAVTGKADVQVAALAELVQAGELVMVPGNRNAKRYYRPAHAPVVPAVPSRSL